MWRLQQDLLALCSKSHLLHHNTCWSSVFYLFIIYPSLLTAVSLSCVTSVAGLIRVSGYEGRSVSISCPYYNGYESNEKYLCSDPCGNADVLITSTTMGKKRGKYSLHDDHNQRVFTTTISNLTGADEGTYWCGVTVYMAYDSYTEVQLKVGKGN